MTIMNSLQVVCCCCIIMLTTRSIDALWDFAVTTESKIVFLDDRWHELSSSAHQFKQLSALAFDETEEVLYFSDALHKNGSIFALRAPIDDDDVGGGGGGGGDGDGGSSSSSGGSGGVHHFIEKIVHRAYRESIVGIAYDPLNRNVYWTDSHNQRILFISIDNAAKDEPPMVLLDFANGTARPDGIAIDVCRRKLYWTNSDHRSATVERVELDGSAREILVHTDIFLPHGIAVDQLTDRIYWVDDQQGIHFSVESANLDGSDRRVVVKGLSHQPMGLIVTKDRIYWTDLINNAVWSYPKRIATTTTAAVATTTTTTLSNNIVHATTINEAATDRSSDIVVTAIDDVPLKVRSFESQPRGIVARSRYLQTLQNDEHCAMVVRKLKSRLIVPKTADNGTKEELRMRKMEREYCLNGGAYNARRSGLCVCKIGYHGARCETDECHNYCLHGTCSMSPMGFAECNCQQGFYGERCEWYKCTGHCLNGGRCSLASRDGDGDGDGSSREPVCECQGLYGGPRCEHNSTEICTLFCRILKHDPDVHIPFGCYDICDVLHENSKNDADADDGDIYALPKYKHLEVCHSVSSWNMPIIVVVSGAIICLCLVLLILHSLRRFHKPARPRIKKTFVVKKQAGSDTPLTNRPIATEQCEITIENCCNMNICDTPCFDPKLLQQNMSRDIKNKDDKKILIHSMDEDLY